MQRSCSVGLGLYNVVSRLKNCPMLRVNRGKSKLVTASTSLRFSHLTIIMSSEKPLETNLIRKIAGSFERMLSSPLRLSRAPSPSPMKMDSSSDNPTR